MAVATLKRKGTARTPSPKKAPPKKVAHKSEVLADLRENYGFTFEMVALGDLSADHHYQRTPLEAHIDNLAKDFRIHACGVLYVAVTQKYGNRAILDGQHRWLAAKKSGKFQKLPCIVYHNLTLAQQAELFTYYNAHRRQAHIVDVFKSKIAQGDAAAIHIKDIVGKAGWEIGLGTKRYASVGAATEIYKTFGAGPFAWMINAISRAWRNDPKGATSATILRAVASIYSYYGANAIDFEVLETALAKTTFAQLQGYASSRRLSGQSELTPLCAQVIVELYNTTFGKRREGRLVVPTTSRVFSTALRSYRHNPIDGDAVVGGMNPRIAKK